MAADHDDEAWEAAVRGMIAAVLEVGGSAALVDAAMELALKLADAVEQIAQADGLLPSDVLHTMFIESPTARASRAPWLRDDPPSGKSPGCGTTT
jgi:hypothetical protein